MQKLINILLIGNPYDGHFVRFVKYIHQENANVIIDIFGIEQENKEISSECITSVRNVYLFKWERTFARTPVLRNLEFVFKLRLFFKNNVSKQKYDIVNLHCPLYFHMFLLNDLKRISKKLVLTPWGSDVYRISFLERKLVKRLYDASDVVTGNGLRFSEDFMRIFEIPQSKHRCVTMFGDQIDYYIEHKDEVTMKAAKSYFGIKEDDYVITCGYNASMG